ncbi:MAG TPA: MbnP family copper-binding protein [Polyangiaceae bacterium]|nr:MbnP family copper-binding protein [Polyangiaceae bacterium]
MRHDELLGCAITTALCIAAVGCGAADDAAPTYRIEFQGMVGDQPFSCDGEYGDIGLDKTKIKPLDFRFWVHDLALVRANGEAVPLSLKQDQPTSTIRDDGAWQKDNVALLDMENATGSCTGSPETRTHVIGTAARHDDYTGLRFKVGVPRVHNNVNAPLAEYPFGAPGMAWQWKGGYRFVRVDVSAMTKPKYYFHLGSTACEGEPADSTGEQGGINCAVENVAPIALEGFNPETDKVRVDIATLYTGIDVDSPNDRNYACMSGGTTNTMCPSMFGALGLTYGTAFQPARQSFFRVR